MCSCFLQGGSRACVCFFLFLIVVFLQRGFCPGLRSEWKPLGSWERHQATWLRPRSPAPGWRGPGHMEMLPTPHVSAGSRPTRPALGLGRRRTLSKAPGCGSGRNAGSRTPTVRGSLPTESVLSRIRGVGGGPRSENRLCWLSLQILSSRRCALTVLRIWGEGAFLFFFFRGGSKWVSFPSPACLSPKD